MKEQIENNSDNPSVEGALRAPDLNSTVCTLPDGSAFAVMSFPLPKNHWLTDPSDALEDSLVNNSPLACPPESRLQNYLGHLLAKGTKFGLRGASMRGKENDIDPDALVQNVKYGLLGPLATAYESRISPIRRHASTYPARMELLMLLQLAVLDDIIDHNDIAQAVKPDALDLASEAYTNWQADRVAAHADVLVDAASSGSETQD